MGDDLEAPLGLDFQHHFLDIKPQVSNGFPPNLPYTTHMTLLQPALRVLNRCLQSQRMTSTGTSSGRCVPRSGPEMARLALAPGCWLRVTA